MILRWLGNFQIILPLAFALISVATLSDEWKPRHALVPLLSPGHDRAGMIGFR